MNVTKKNVEEEWVWQSGSLDLVCLYKNIDIYLNYLIIEKQSPNKFLTQVCKKKKKDSQIELWNHITKYIKERLYQQASQSVSLGQRYKIYNHKYIIHTVSKKKTDQNKCRLKNEGVFILYLALEDDPAAIIALLEKSTLCKMVE